MNVAAWELCVCLYRLRYRRLSLKPFIVATYVVTALRSGICLADVTSDMHYHRSEWRPRQQSSQWIEPPLAAFCFVRLTHFNPSSNLGYAIFNAMFLVLCFVWFS